MPTALLKRPKKTRNAYVLQFLVLNTLPLRALLKKLLLSKRRQLGKSAAEPEARALDISDPELHSWGASFAACCFLASLLGLLDKQSPPRMERNSANSTLEYMVWVDGA